MTRDEAIKLIREMLKAPDEDQLTQIISLNISRFDGVFFGVLHESVEQLKREGKPEIATALESLSTKIMRMRWLI